MPSNVNCFDAISKNLSIKIYRYIYAKEKCAKRDKNRGEVFDFFEKKGQKTLANKNKVCYNNQAFENGLMVKRLRRRPLTAETGVRFPMGLPKRKGQIYICPFLFGNLSGNWTGAKRLFARKPGRGGPSGVSADSPWGGYLSLSFWYFLRELNRRAPRGCSRERSDALPRGPLRGFGRFPPRPSPSRTGFLPVLSFWYFSPGIEQARTARLFARAKRRSAEGPPPGFRQFFRPHELHKYTDKFLSINFYLLHQNS